MNQPTSQHEYLVLSRGQWDEHASVSEVQRAIDKFYAWYEANVAAGRMKPGSRLAREGKLVSKASTTDGPFAEIKELVGGYWFIIASSLDEAAALAAENPCLAYGLSLEVRALDPQRATASAVTSETPSVWRKER
jgi:hypothetical protein